MERIRFPRLSLSFPLLLLGVLVLPLVLECGNESGFENPQAVSSEQPAPRQGEDAPGPDDGEPGLPARQGGGGGSSAPGQLCSNEAGQASGLLRIERLDPGSSWSIDIPSCPASGSGDSPRRLTGTDPAAPCLQGGKNPPVRGPPAV